MLVDFVSSDDDVDNDGDDNGLEWNSSSLLSVLPVEIIIGSILSYLDVQTLVETKLVSRQWRHITTAAIDNKGIGTTRKSFETNEELQNAVKRYCPRPQGGIKYDGHGNTTSKQEYCDREVAEEISCTYGWPINKWDVSKIQDFSGVFCAGGESRWNYETRENEPIDGIQFFNEDISEWNVSNATTMQYMFFLATKFNQNLSTWKVSNVRDMSFLFRDAHKFNQDLSTWNVSNVTNMEYMFSDTEQFHQDISTWDVSNVRDMERMFSNAKQFNQNLSTWDVSNVTNMEHIFDSAEQFNQDVSTWGEEWAARLDEL